MIFVLSFVYVVRVWLLCFHYFCLVCNDYQKNNVTKLHTMLVVWNHGDGFTNWPSFTVCIILFSFFFFWKWLLKSDVCMSVGIIFLRDSQQIVLFHVWDICPFWLIFWCEWVWGEKERALSLWCLRTNWWPVSAEVGRFTCTPWGT